MRPFATTIPLADALAILRGVARPAEATETVPLPQACGRVLAEEIRARTDIPPFDRAAMDGYAVQARDTAHATADAPAILTIAGAVFTGDAPGTTVAPGAAVTIATGAPVPAGADAVVMVEHTSPGDAGTVRIHAPVAPRQNVGRAGGDIASGEIAARVGDAVTPARLGALAAVGATEVLVFVRPRVFLASTGNEIAAPGRPLGPGQVYDINRFTLAAVVEQHGGEPIAGPTAADSIESLRAVLDAAEASAADVIVLSGGSSVGDRDLLIDAVRERGEVLFHGIAVKPGKPTLLARLGSRVLLGMPGNPTSCLSNAYILLIPLLRRMARLPEWRPQRLDVPLAREVTNTSARHTFLTVRIEGEKAVPAFKGSGNITSLADADGYIEIAADVTHVAAGTTVTVTLF
jgi:molybdenum cofactor synthesis domain-containing protein